MEVKVPTQVKQYYIAVGSRDVKLVRPCKRSEDVKLTVFCSVWVTLSFPFGNCCARLGRVLYTLIHRQPKKCCNRELSARV